MEMAAEMSLHYTSFRFSPLKENTFRFSSPINCLPQSRNRQIYEFSSTFDCFTVSSRFRKFPSLHRRSCRTSKLRPIRAAEKPNDEFKTNCTEENDPYLMDDEERYEWRQKIREVINAYPDVEEEIDPDEKRNRMQKLLADYPLVVEEDDPDWPDDADGWGFNLGQFFDKITIKNVKKDEDDENYDSDKELVWQDDNYIQPIKDVTATEWEETVFKDISPLIILVHNRYKRPKENEKVRDELEKAVHLIWNCRLPSPRCVAVDAVRELDLVSALQVSVFPEIIFTKAGRILYRDDGSRTADELSKIMAYFYYGAAKPPCLTGVTDSQESIPTFAS